MGKSVTGGREQEVGISVGVMGQGVAWGRPAAGLETVCGQVS